MPDVEPNTEQPVATQPGEEVKKSIEEKEILTWAAPARPFKRRNRDFYVTVIAIAALVGLILFLVDGFMPVLLIVSLVFLMYVMSTVEPEELTYTITNKGIKIADKRTDWESIGRFWFTKRFDNELLVMEISQLPGRMELVVPEDKKADIKKALDKYLLHEEVPPSGLDKAANWFAKKLPQS
jgi:hypothetical protein